jgi:acetolactate synthase I/II/III large subunit
VTTRSGGRAVVDALVAGGVQHAFTVPGESFLTILDALHDAPVRTVATRHEGGAAFMAEAVGQLTGRPAVCLATRAVGAANLAIGLHTAYADSTPMVAVVGQVPRSVRGREAFQEADQVATFGGLCKAAAEIDDPATLAREAARLIRVAQSGRPGPVLMAIPEDVLAADVETPDAERVPDAPPPPSPSTAATTKALTALAGASAPVIVAGAGVLRAGASEGLAALAQRISVPVIASWRRPDVMPNDDPLYLGMSGLGASAAVHDRLRRADLILALGCRLNAITTDGYAIPGPTTWVIHVDLEPGWPGRPAPAIAIRSDARAFIAEALRLAGDGIGAPTDLAGRQAANARDRAAYEAGSTPPALRGRGDPIEPAAVVLALQQALPDDAVITTDAGNFAAWYARFLRLGAGQRFLGPTSGAMGYGLPAAVGAGIARPGSPVVALAGDGGMAMLMAELETAVRENVRLTVLVHDNQRYGTIRMHQERAHPGRVMATELGPIDFAAVARACGARGLTIDHRTQLPDALAEAMASEAVSLLHLRMDPTALSVDSKLVR